MLQVLLERTRGLLHPENHRSQDCHRGETDDCFEELLLALGEFRAGQIERDADDEAERCGDAGADPDREHQPIGAGLLQIAGGNTHDEGSLDSLSQHDKKGDKHALK